MLENANEEAEKRKKDYQEGIPKDPPPSKKNK